VRHRSGELERTLTDVQRRAAAVDDDDVQASVSGRGTTTSDTAVMQVRVDVLHSPLSLVFWETTRKTSSHETPAPPVPQVIALTTSHTLTRALG